MRPTALVLLAALTLSGCGTAATSSGSDPTGGSGSPAATSGTDSSVSGSGNVRVSTTTARFSASPGGSAVTYAEDLVPVGAAVTVGVRSADGTTTVELDVRGLQPDRGYGAHVHAGRCGPTGDAAGPHHQRTPDPVQPSVDPAYANPANEIWLDLTTDPAGVGRASSTVPWELEADRLPQSVVVHETATATGPGKAGTAGGRVGCVTVDF